MKNIKTGNGKNKNLHKMFLKPFNSFGHILPLTLTTKTLIRVKLFLKMLEFTHRGSKDKE